MKLIKRRILPLLYLVILSTAIACGGGGGGEPVIPDPGTLTEKAKDKIQEPLISKEKPKEQLKAESEKKVSSKTEDKKVEKITTVAPEKKIIESLEQPAMTLAILEGAVEFRLDQESDWIAGFDAQPIEQGWSVKTLNVSSAVLNFADGSMVLLEPNTEVYIQLYQVINGGPENGGERHAQIRLIDGVLDFDVIPAPSPPSTWAFLTTDGAVTIQGTGGSLARTIDINEDGELEVNYSTDLLEGTATMIRMGQDENDDQILQAVVIQPGISFEVTEKKSLDSVDITNDPVLSADIAKAVELDLPVPEDLQDIKPTEDLEKQGLPVNTVEMLYRKGGQVEVKNKIVTCPICKGSGYMGQVGIFETLFLDSETRKHLIAGDLKAATTHARRNKMYIRLQEAAWQKVAEGITSLEEFGRVNIKKSSKKKSTASK